ncbi:short-chain dehydrogenase, 3-oxoacyl-ACP reductase [Advenella kashmirensis WT001]|uniref:Short-chain dehydrogenase, 3-oxoacyl-ACP reductase n=1 Tax=Advenella kashmirensis (strain DSM 17095 / LMG 22695 / WT001) TaxID=1036672 RepID=I3UCM7_ADVKW|nr:SDR family oxidoreductase [Advenella kashmirensis]AFK62765.1 short-chain dehydrogenase, 3-oxoacyl-ACP reductase [Advenella kashmirensis WT001]
MNVSFYEPDAASQLMPASLGQAPSRSRLQGRRILVVGAGQRIVNDDSPPIGNGRAISVLFAREGANIACVDVCSEAVEQTVRQIQEEGGSAIAEVADVSQSDTIEPLVRRCAERLGGIDGLVLNVGISKGLKLSDQDAESWDYEYAVNVRSHMLFSKVALTLMPPGSTIVLMSSLASLRVLGKNPAYESSKAAQVSLARSIAASGEPNGIRCNSVLPGLMDTPMGRDATRRRPDRANSVPFGRQGTGWEVAYACLFLTSDESSYVNGHALLVDGGLSCGISRQ